MKRKELLPGTIFRYKSTLSMPPSGILWVVGVKGRHKFNQKAPNKFNGQYLFYSLAEGKIDQEREVEMLALSIEGPEDQVIPEPEWGEVGY